MMVYTLIFIVLLKHGVNISKTANNIQSAILIQ